MDLSNIDASSSATVVLACAVLWELRQQRVERAAQEGLRNAATLEATRAYDRLTRWVVRISERLGFSDAPRESGPVRRTPTPPMPPIARSRKVTDDPPPAEHDDADDNDDGVPG